MTLLIRRILKRLEVYQRSKCFGYFFDFFQFKLATCTNSPGEISLYAVIAVKDFIHRRNNVTKVRIEPRSWLSKRRFKPLRLATD